MKFKFTTIETFENVYEIEADHVEDAEEILLGGVEPIKNNWIEEEIISTEEL